METLRDLDVVRAISRPLHLRDAAADPQDGRIGTLFGYSTVFDTWYEVDSYFEGKFLERVAAGSAAKTIRESGDNVKVLFNHGRDMTINNKVLGVHEDLREDDVGVYYQVPMLDTSYNRDLLPGLQAGAYGSSFMFRIIQDSWNDEPGVSDHNPTGIPERTIQEYRLYEHGPVTFPANPAAPSGARSMCSMTDDYYAYVRDTNPARYDELVARAALLRTPDAPRGTDGVPDAEGAATQETTEPREHSGVSPEARARALDLLSL